MDVRLPAQLRRPVQVAGPLRGVSPIGQAAVIDARLAARLRQHPIRRLLPRLAGLLQPVPGLGRPALARPALLRGLGVVPLEPLRGAARDPVVAALGEHQVRVGVLPVRAAAVEGERIGQPLPGAHPLGERARERAPPPRVQFARQGELDLAVEPPVGALVLVSRLPVGVWVVLRPRGHVAVLYMLAFLAVRGIAPLALDVIILGAGGLPTGAGTEAGLEVIDGRSYIEHTTQADQVSMTRLMKGLDAFLERDQDRALFDLAANTEPASAGADPRPGWRPHRLPTGNWGAIYNGDTATLPAELVGATITVQAKNGQRWTTTVTAVLDRSRDQVIVTDSERPTSP